MSEPIAVLEMVMSDGQISIKWKRACCRRAGSGRTALLGPSNQCWGRRMRMAGFIAPALAPSRKKALLFVAGSSDSMTIQLHTTYHYSLMLLRMSNQNSFCSPPKKDSQASAHR